MNNIINTIGDILNIVNIVCGVISFLVGSGIVKFISFICKKHEIYVYDKFHEKLKLTLKAIIFNDFSKKHILCLKGIAWQTYDCHKEETIQHLEYNGYVTGASTGINTNAGKVLTNKGKKLFQKQCREFIRDK